MASYAILTNGYRAIPTAGTHIADWEYNVSGNNIYLTKYIGSSKHIVVPNTMGNYNVYLATNTGNSRQDGYGTPFQNNQEIESIKIESGVGFGTGFNYYFANCTNLKTIDARNCENFYGGNAQYMFYNCTNLLRINAPERWKGNNPFNVRQMDSMFANCRSLIESPIIFNGETAYDDGGSMFRGCWNLTTIPVIPNTNGNTCYSCNGYGVNFYDCRKLKSIPIKGGYATSDSFHNCHSLENQPSAYYNEQGNNMFRNCYNLKGTITLRNGSYVNAACNFNSVCENCYNITGVTFASGANRMGSFTNAFRNCYSLSSVGAINNASYLEDLSYAFANCGKLTSVPWSWGNDANYYYAFYNSGITTAFSTRPVNGANYHSAFINCKNLTSIGNINGYAYTKLNNAFQNCLNLTSVPYIQNAYIDNAFKGCNNLTSVGSLINIHCANFAFENCRNITEINTVTVNGYGSGCFKFCTNLRYINSMGINYGSAAFAQCHNLKAINSTITFGNNFTNIFYNCQNLTSVEFGPYANTYSMNYAFYNCTNLTSITLRNVYLNMAEYMCQGCTNLINFTIDYNYSDTTNCCCSNYAFAQCSNLKNINIISSNNTSNSVKFYFRNTNHMFQDCSALTKIPFNGSHFYSTNNCFENCANLKTANINHPSFNIFANTFKDTNITKLDAKTTGLNIAVTMSSAFPQLTSFNGYLSSSIANLFGNCPNLTTVTNLRFDGSYPNYAFQNCKKLTSVHFNNSTSFSNGYGMFKNCTNLTTTTGNIYVTSDARYMFDGCVKLTGNIFVNYTNISYMNGMFNNTSLSKNLYIPFKRNTSTTYNSMTYNAAIANGVSGNNGVTLYNIQELLV